MKVLANLPCSLLLVLHDPQLFFVLVMLNVTAEDLAMVGEYLAASMCAVSFTATLSMK